MLKKILNKFILFCLARKGIVQNIIDENDEVSIKRHMPFGYDEFIDAQGRVRRPLKWYRPAGFLIHRWLKSDGAAFHDHPRWSITICLRGEMTEVTPWNRKILKPGSVVIRSRKAIHRFEIEPKFKGKTWTLFIVGRRRHKQNYYFIKSMYPTGE